MGILLKVMHRDVVQGLLHQDHKAMSVMFAMFVVLLFAAHAFSEGKETISKNVDTVVAAINSGKDASSFSADAYNPYVLVSVVVAASLVLIDYHFVGGVIAGGFVGGVVGTYTFHCACSSEVG